MSLTSAELIAHERAEMVRVLRESDPSAPTLCEGWEARHLLAHLLLRESSVSYAAGVVGGPLGARTDRLTDELAEKLADRAEYDAALAQFASLPGHLKMRSRKPAADAAMNTIEYFVHCEDVVRADSAREPRVERREVQERIWADLIKRARTMVGKDYKDGLVLEAPGYSPVAVTVVAPPAGQVAKVLSGEPGELLLYLFGREEAAQVKVS